MSRSHARGKSQSIECPCVMPHRGHITPPVKWQLRLTRTVCVVESARLTDGGADSCQLNKGVFLRRVFGPLVMLRDRKSGRCTTTYRV